MELISANGLIPHFPNSDRFLVVAVHAGGVGSTALIVGGGGIAGEEWGGSGKGDV